MLSLNIFLCQRGKSYLYDALKSLGFKISLNLIPFVQLVLTPLEKHLGDLDVQIVAA